MTDDLLTWLRAQLDEDERVAREATPGPWRWVDPGGKVKSALVGPGYPYQTVVPVAGGDVYPSVYDAEHIARHDPARVLAEVDAKRRILDRHRPHLLKAQTFRPAMLQCEHCADLCHSRSGLGCDEPIDAPWPCPDIRDIASLYAARPGYREEWKP